MDPLMTILMSVFTIGAVFFWVFYGIPRRYAQTKERLRVERQSEIDRGLIEDDGSDPYAPTPTLSEDEPASEFHLGQSDLFRVNALRASRGLHPLTELPSPARSLESLAESATAAHPAGGEGLLARYAAARRAPERQWGRLLLLAAVFVGICALLFLGPA
jgi:hypothetical protein